MHVRKWRKDILIHCWRECRLLKPLWKTEWKFPRIWKCISGSYPSQGFLLCFYLPHQVLYFQYFSLTFPLFFEEIDHLRSCQNFLSQVFASHWFFEIIWACFAFLFMNIIIFTVSCWISMSCFGDHILFSLIMALVFPACLVLLLLIFPWRFCSLGCVPVAQCDIRKWVRRFKKPRLERESVEHRAPDMGVEDLCHQLGSCL